MIAAIPTGIVQAVAGAVAVGVFMLLGKGADWLIKRRPERKGEKAVESADKRADGADERAEEHADLTRLRTMADEAYRWAGTQQARADQIAGERDTMKRTLTAKIDALSLEVGRMNTAIGEKDALIAAQAQKIAHLEKRVGDLEKHERRAAQDIS